MKIMKVTETLKKMYNLRDALADLGIPLYQDISHLGHGTWVTAPLEDDDSYGLILHMEYSAATDTCSIYLENTGTDYEDLKKEFEEAWR